MTATRNLHELIRTETSRRGFNHFIEHPDYPLGLTPAQAADLLRRGDSATFLLVPADLVENSFTAMRIRTEKIDLGRRYVVYVAERMGVGSGNDYG